MKQHRCYAGRNGWQTCILCDGRIHAQDCTSKPDARKDCCPQRHERMGLPVEEAQIRKPA